MPPTTNHAYINLRGRGGRCLSNEARKFKEEAAKFAMVMAHVQKWKYQEGARLSLSLTFYFNRGGKRDIDNRVKLLADALAKTLGFDDSVIDRIVLQRGAKVADEYCAVQLEPLNEIAA
jgi:Holliday junction resolvase RusA-like endonuclease